MGNLGTMEPEEILQLLTGSVVCGLVIFVFIVVYVVIARRGKSARKRPGLGTGGHRQETIHWDYRAETPYAQEKSIGTTGSDPLVAGMLLKDQPARIDVSARLVGTGREAWLEEGSSHSLGTSVADNHAPDHGQEILRLCRDVHTGQMYIQVAGVRYRSLNDIRDRAVGERILAAITHLLCFSKGMVATDQGVVNLDLPACDVVEVPTAFGVLSETRQPGEMLRLMSKSEQDRFCVHVAGQCYRQLVDVTERETGRYILEAITRVLQFSNGVLATNDGVGVVPVPPLGADVWAPLPAVIAPDSSVSNSATARATLAPSLDSQPTQPSDVTPSGSGAQAGERDVLDLIMSQTPPSQSPTPVERPSLAASIRRMRKGTSAEPLPSLDLAGEIDRIFQSKLLAAGMGVRDARVETNPDGGVRIRIGTACYDSPDEVPDPHLRDMLKLSILEWERS
jgi:hypothetical protein